MKQRGFTLIEVMVAMAILAGSGIAIFSMANGSVRNTPVLVERNLARIVADNHLVDLRLKKTNPSSGWQWQEEKMANRTWQVRHRSVPTANPAFKAIEVEVFSQRSDTAPRLAHLQTFVSGL